LVSIS
jgi:hypothetical protein